MPLRVACMWKKRILHSLSLYLQALLDFFFPRYCLCCRRRMSPCEEVLCVRCQADLPRVRTVSFEENDIARIFWGLVPIEKGISFLHYTPHSPHSRILFELKYHNHPEVGKTMGRMMAEELKATNFFNGIDLIVPIPLSRKKERQRGYNQSDWIAWGISEATGIPTDTTSVVRTKSNPRVWKAAISFWWTMSSPPEPPCCPAPRPLPVPAASASACSASHGQDIRKKQKTTVIKQDIMLLSLYS